MTDNDKEQMPINLKEYRLTQEVTRRSIQNLIKKVTYFEVPGTSVVICNILVLNGYSVFGDSVGLGSLEFHKDVLEDRAYRAAFSNLWQLEGYLLAENRYMQTIFNNNIKENLVKPHLNDN